MDYYNETRKRMAKQPYFNDERLQAMKEAKSYGWKVIPTIVEYLDNCRVMFEEAASSSLNTKEVEGIDADISLALGEIDDLTLKIEENFYKDPVIGKGYRKLTELRDILSNNEDFDFSKASSEIKSSISLIKECAFAVGREDYLNEVVKMQKEFVEKAKKTLESAVFLDMEGEGEINPFTEKILNSVSKDFDFKFEIEFPTDDFDFELSLTSSNSYFIRSSKYSLHEVAAAVDKAFTEIENNLRGDDSYGFDFSYYRIKEDRVCDNARIKANEEYMHFNGEISTLIEFLPNEIASSLEYYNGNKFLRLFDNNYDIVEGLKRESNGQEYKESIRGQEHKESVREKLLRKLQEVKKNTPEKKEPEHRREEAR